MRTEDSQRRFCEQCQCHVRDLSALSRPDGERLLAGVNGETCISYRTRPDGSMIVRTRWNGLAGAWSGLRRGGWALLAVIAPMWLFACTNRDDACDRTGGVYVANGDGKDSPPKKKHHPPPEDRVMGTPTAQ